MAGNEEHVEANGCFGVGEVSEEGGGGGRSGSRSGKIADIVVVESGCDADDVDSGVDTSRVG